MDKRLKSSSSSESVVLQDDDLLTLILLRVPPRELKVLKRVSRQWHSLITTPHFRSLLLPSLGAPALFIQHPLADHSKFYSLSLEEDCNPPFPVRTHTFAHDPGGNYNDPVKIEILSSCNGLLLCSTFTNSPGTQIDYYVYDTLSSQLTTLPKHPCHTWPGGIRYVGIAFDPSKSLHYKVIVFFIVHHDVINGFHIYSSDTETWKAASAQPLIPTQRMHLVNGVYWNGCIHWLGEYAGCSSFLLNVDEERLETFPRPPPLTAGAPITGMYFGESADHLHYAQVCPCETSLRVYEMKSDYSEWFVKYQIDLVPISKAFPEMKRCERKYNFAVISIARRKNFNEDSFLILEIPGKIIRYNLVDGSFKVIWDFVVISSWSRGNKYKAWSYFE